MYIIASLLFCTNSVETILFLERIVKFSLRSCNNPFCHVKIGTILKPCKSILVSSLHFPCVKFVLKDETGYVQNKVNTYIPRFTATRLTAF